MNGVGPTHPTPHTASKVNVFWTTIFLLPIFFQRLFVGGEADSYDEFRGIALIALGYICHISIVARFAIAPVRKSTMLFVLKCYTPLVIVSGFHAFVLVMSSEIGSSAATFAIFRQLLWLLSCLVMVRFTNPDLLLWRLIQLTHFTFVVIVLTYVFYLVTNIPLQLILRAGVPRAQGFLTEPSAVGCLLAGYAALAVYERNWRRLLYAVGISVCVNSVISFAGLAIGITSGAIQFRVSTQSIRRMCVVALLLIAPVGLAIAPLFSHEISGAASDAMQSIEATPFGESAIYLNFGERVLGAASLLDDGIKVIKAGDNTTGGELFRFTSILLLLEQMKQSWRLFGGYGLGAHAQLMEANHESLLDFGILPFALSSFGLIGGLAVFWWLIWTVSGSTERIAVYAVPFVAIISLNSAGGIHMYSVALLAAFLMSRRSISKRATASCWPAITSGTSTAPACR
jgi:hypothetical protein